MEVAGWFVGAGIGTIFTALYEGVKKLMGRTTNFKVQLEALKLTLESFDLEVIQQIGRHNEALSLPNEDVKALEEKLNEGVRIIGELSDARLWNRMESRYISQLVQLNRSLIVLERRLKMQSIRDVKETRHMMQILLITLTLHQEPCRDGHGHGSLLSTTRLLDIAPQEALHQILTLDSVRNIASTSTNLRQLHGNENQRISLLCCCEETFLPSEIESASEPLPSPLGSNQPLINGGQLVTTSRNSPPMVPRKLILKVEFHCERCKYKVLKLAVGTQGVDSVSIQQDSRYLEVIGRGVDSVALVKYLRKRMGAAAIQGVEEAQLEEKRVGFVDIQELEEVKWEEKPIRRKSKYIKISKWFKRTIPW